MMTKLRFGSWRSWGEGDTGYKQANAFLGSRFPAAAFLRWQSNVVILCLDTNTAKIQQLLEIRYITDNLGNILDNPADSGTITSKFFWRLKLNKIL
jgi:hypothetical protein